MQNNYQSHHMEFKRRIYQYSLNLIKFLQYLPKEPIYREISGQLVRSGTSIGANYFEAQGASSKKDYQNYFNHSLKSSNESRFWLSLLKESGLVSQECLVSCDALLKETQEFANIFAPSILTMKGRR
ncbi:MAG: four helix bundle protein [Deltaproteobacteria bacterium]|nr:four helix bundle protein [Deltaproteobacteria bacterium]